MKWWIMVLLPLCIEAQVPQGMNYQSILRDANGKPLSQQSIAIRFSILQGGATGRVIFSEEHRTATNAFGLTNVLIGYGFPIQSRLNQVDWSQGPYYLKTEIDPNGGSVYELTSVSPLISVPYAFYAEKTNLKAGSGIELKDNILRAFDSSAQNELQVLDLTGLTLSLSKGGGSVTLPTGADQWGTQVVQTASRLTGNGTLNLPLDIQLESIESQHIRNGSLEKEDLAAGVVKDYLAGQGIDLSGGVITNTGDLSDQNELQQLSYDLASRTLSLSKGNSISFPANSSSRISDSDNNTYIETEKTANENAIRFGISGDEWMILKSNPYNSPILHFEGPGSNLFIGRDAGLSNDGKTFPLGFGNAFIGQFSGVYNYSGSRNSALGTYALWGNVMGNENVAIGYESLLLGENGTRNTALGFRSMMNFMKGNNNVAIGPQTLMNTDGGSINIAIGSASQAFSKNRNAIIAIGDSSLYFNGNGVSDVNKAVENMAIGSKAMYSNTAGSENIAIGNQSMYANETGDRNTGIGVASLFSNRSGNFNTGVGFHALFANETGNSNVAMGNNSLSANLDGEGNIAIGSTAMFGNLNGNMNTAVGFGALFSNSSGTFNVALGSNALATNSTGINNVAVGTEALTGNVQGLDNTAIGTFALYENVQGYNNTAVGKQSGSFGNQNQYCTYLGDQAKNNGSINLQYSTAVGANSRVTASNQVRIGDPNTVSVGGYKSWTNVSDGRYKKDIREDVKGLPFILKLRPVGYQLDLDALDLHLGIERPQAIQANKDAAENAQTVRQYGFIAQEVEQASKACAFDFCGVDKPQNESDLYGLRYADFVVPLVKAMQEQQEMIEEQRKYIESLEKRLTLLEDKLFTSTPLPNK